MASQLTNYKISTDNDLLNHMKSSCENDSKYYTLDNTLSELDESEDVGNIMDIKLPFPKSQSENNQLNNNIDGHKDGELDEEYNMEKISNWSPSETLTKIIQHSGVNVPQEVYQVFVKEYVRDKCVNDDDIRQFNKNMEIINQMEIPNNEDELIKILKNPNFVKSINDIYQMIDNINTLCILGTGDKINMINNKNHKSTMKQQIKLCRKLVEKYKYGFAKMVSIMDKFNKQKSLSQESEMKYDPILNELNDDILIQKLSKLKDRLMMSIYMHQRDNYVLNNNKDTEIETNSQSNTSDINTKDNHKTKQCEKNKLRLDIIPMILIILVIVIFIIMSQK